MATDKLVVGPMIWIFLTLSPSGPQMEGRQTEEPQAAPVPCREGILEDAIAIYKPIPPGGAIRSMCRTRNLKTPLIRYTIDADGRVRKIDFVRSSGCAEADEELRRCIAKWVFKPAECSGAPFPKEQLLYINFGFGAPPVEKRDFCPTFEESKQQEPESKEQHSLSEEGP